MSSSSDTHDVFRIQIANVTAAPTDRLSGALSLTVELESAGLVHFVVRRAGKHGDGVISDHVVVHKGALDVNETVRSTTAPGGAAATGVVGDTVSAVEIVEGLEPGATYEVGDSRWIYWGHTVLA